MTVLTFLFLLQCLPETYLRTPMDLHAELGDRYHSFSFTRILRECCGGHLYTSIHDHAPLLSSSSSPESSALYTERNHNSDYESSVSKSSNSGIYMSTTSLSSTSLLKPTPVYSKLHDEQDI